MKRSLSVLIVAAAVVAGGCFKTSSTVTPSTTSGLSGTWTSIESLPGAGGSLAEACTNFRWAVTEYTGTTGAGTFSALCLGNIQVTGSARGTLVGTTVNWTANATGDRWPAVRHAPSRSPAPRRSKPTASASPTPARRAWGRSAERRRLSDDSNDMSGE